MYKDTLLFWLHFVINPVYKICESRSNKRHWRENIFYSVTHQLHLNRVITRESESLFMIRFWHMKAAMWLCELQKSGTKFCRTLDQRLTSFIAEWKQKQPPHKTRTNGPLLNPQIVRLDGWAAAAVNLHPQPFLWSGRGCKDQRHPNISRHFFS